MGLTLTRRGFLVRSALSAGALAGLRLGATAEGPPGEHTSAWSESFADGLSATRWAVTAQGDFEERTVDVVAGGPRGGDGRLRVRLATRGTRDDTVKFLGVRSVERVALGEGASVAAELDWNDQANGSYLSAALVLSPAATDANPLDGPEWLKVEYVGVPPGRNARLVVASSAAGRERSLHTEGWPGRNREGRPIGLQRIRIRFGRRSFEVWENERRVYAASEPLGFAAAHLYLQVSSHSNYPPREVFFDEIRVGDAS